MAYNGFAAVPPFVMDMLIDRESLNFLPLGSLRGPLVPLLTALRECRAYIYDQRRMVLARVDSESWLRENDMMICWASVNYSVTEVFAPEDVVQNALGYWDDFVASVSRAVRHTEVTERHLRFRAHTYTDFFVLMPNEEWGIPTYRRIRKTGPNYVLYAQHTDDPQVITLDDIIRLGSRYFVQTSQFVPLMRTLRASAKNALVKQGTFPGDHGFRTVFDSISTKEDAIRK